MNTLRILIFLALKLLFISWGAASELSFKPIATLPQPIAQQVIAISPITKSKLDQQYLVASASGQLAFLDANRDKFTMLNHQLPSNEPLSNQLLGDQLASETEGKTLLAIALHPNFNTREQEGYHAFYTAHQAPVNKANNKTNRIFDRQINADTLTQEIVIQEWQLSDNIEQGGATIREVLSIGLPTPETTKVQLAFNPYHKAWDDNFGLLHIGLSAIEGFVTSPLYSGAILRIQPKAFGLKAYTIPQSNPFITKAEINPEIYRFKLSRLGNFIWPNRTEETLWIDHQDKQTRKISRASIPISTVFQFDNRNINEHQILAYYSRQADTLYGSTFVVSDHQDQPYLTSLTKNATEDGYQLTPLIALNTPLPVKLFNGANDEVLMYHPATGTLSSLVIALADSTNSEALTTEPYTGNLRTGNLSTGNSNIGHSNAGIDKFVVILLILMLTSWGSWLIYRKINAQRFSVTSFYQQQFKHLELSSDQRIVHLFKAHQSIPSKSLTLSNISTIKLLLNNIAIVEITPQQGMTNDFANIWRQTCNIEKREKMVTGKLRHIQLAFLDSDKQIYLVSLYLRKGDNRISKASYQTANSQLVDWAWRLSALIAPETTEIRDTTADESLEKSRRINTIQSNEVDVKQTSEKVTEPLTEHLAEPLTEPLTDHLTKQSSEAFNKTKQAKESASAEHVDMPTLKTMLIRQPVSDKTIAEPTIPEPSITEPTISAPATEPTVSQNDELSRGQTDAQLIAALEKLASLKKQNYLTKEEFEQAKAKLLNDLI